MTSNLQKTWLASGCWMWYEVFLEVPTELVNFASLVLKRLLEVIDAAS